MRPIVVLIVLLACAAASAGEVYKWKDKDGRVHYGDKPKDAAGEAVMVESSSGSGVPSENEAARLAREKECQTKKAQLENWRRAPTMSEIDNIGKQREYTPAEREQFLALQQQKVDSLCAPPPAQAQSDTFPPPAPPEETTEIPPEEPPAE